MDTPMEELLVADMGMVGMAGTGTARDQRRTTGIRTEQNHATVTDMLQEDHRQKESILPWVAP